MDSQRTNNSVTLGEIRKRMNSPAEPPYAKCIEQLNKLSARIKGMTTPMEKMNAIAQISTEIKKAVHEFWKGVNVS